MRVVSLFETGMFSMNNSFTLASLGCSINLLQPFIQSTQEDPGQVVGLVSLLCHYQG